MRTATPFVTCSSMVDCSERATAGDISTPSFMGPGCMTSAPGRARASRSSFTREGRGGAARRGGGGGARDAAVGDLADDAAALAAEVAEVGAHRVDVVQPLGGMSVPAIAAVDDVHLHVAGGGGRGTGGGVAAQQPPGAPP